MTNIQRKLIRQRRSAVRGCLAIVKKVMNSHEHPNGAEVTIQHQIEKKLQRLNQILGGRK